MPLQPWQFDKFGSMIQYAFGQFDPQVNVEQWIKYFVDQYDAPGRYYHNAQHLFEVSQELWIIYDNKLPGDYHKLVMFAGFWHDFIYDPKAKDNEERSAKVAHDNVLELTGEIEYAKEVHDEILSTKSHVATWVGEEYLIDADLARFSMVDQGKYAAQIRQEYAWVPDDIYWPARIAVLEKFLDRDPFYYKYDVHYDNAAYKNIKEQLEHAKTFNEKIQTAKTAT